MLQITSPTVYLVVSAASVGSLPAIAQPTPEALEKRELSDLNGLVVDETITKVGRDFYEVFYRQWEAPASEMSYTIFIKELPAPGRGSQVLVYMDDTELFNQAVQPRYEVIEELAAYSVQLVTHYVANYESMSQQLGNEDQQGSGIF